MVLSVIKTGKIRGWLFRGVEVKLSQLEEDMDL